MATSTQEARAEARRRAIESLGSTRIGDRSRLSEHIEPKTRLRLFLQAAVFDFVLVLLVSVALTYTVSYGFHSAWDYRDNVALITGLTVPILVALFAGSWSKRALAPSIVAVVVLAVGIIGVFLGLSSEPFFLDGSVNDVEGNYGIFAVVIVVVPVVVYLLSRRTAGLVVLDILASGACGLVQFLYRDWISEQPGILMTVLVMFGLGMLFVYQCYRQSVYSANRVKRTSFSGAFAFSLVLCAVCVAVGMGVFFGIVANSGLYTPEVKLLESYVSPPVTDQARDYELMKNEGDNTSDEYSDEESDTDEEGEGNTENPLVEASESMLESTLVGQLAQQFAGLDLDNDDPEDEENAAKYQLAMQLMWAIIAALVVAFVVLVVCLWRYRRTWRLKRIAKRSNAYQAYFLYTFLVGRFRRVRIAKPDYMTPLQFAAGHSKAMLPYTRGTEGVDFVEVASVYQDAVYGAIEPTDGQMERLRRYYRCFYRNAFKETPWPKWVFWRFWRL